MTVSPESRRARLAARQFFSAISHPGSQWISEHEIVEAESPYSIQRVVDHRREGYVSVVVLFRSIPAGAIPVEFRISDSVVDWMSTESPREVESRLATDASITWQENIESFGDRLIVLDDSWL
jgi:hypothetical protein